MPYASPTMLAGGLFTLANTAAKYPAFFVYDPSANAPSLWLLNSLLAEVVLAVGRRQKGERYNLQGTIFFFMGLDNTS